LLAALGLSAAAAQAQEGVRPGPNRPAGEGVGPFQRMVISNITLIDGTGGPPRGPVDIIVEGNRIAAIQNAGTPGVPVAANRQFQGANHVIDGTGMYLMPGLIDLHLHTGGVPKAPEAEYYYKIWMAHGITTGRGVPFGDYAWSMSEKQRSARNEITAPRMWSYHRPGTGWTQGPVRTPEQARAWVRWLKAQGADGLKLNAEWPPVMAALIDEAKRNGLGTTAHLAQTGVANMNALDAARLGLGTVTHFYGLFEAMYEEADVQPWPVNMNYNDEQHRFGQVARQWSLVKPGSEKWKNLLRELKENDVTLDPTMVAYLTGRDVAKRMYAPWHTKYTLPSLWDYYSANREAHGSYFYYWTTWDEVAWKNFYRVWLQLLNEYKNMGGRVTASSDAGFIYNTPGFSTIEEMEMLQEGGFHPLEVIRSATMHAAQTLYKPLGREPEIGVIREGFLADMLIVPENPIENLKVLYGTGWPRLNDQTRRVETVGGIRWTIKDGIVYDARKLLEDVARMVEAQKTQRARATSSNR
jgi:imidazolonepropionase-like amidohydrolase